MRSNLVESTDPQLFQRQRPSKHRTGLQAVQQPCHSPLLTCLCPGTAVAGVVSQKGTVYSRLPPVSFQGEKSPPLSHCSAVPWGCCVGAGQEVWVPGLARRKGEAQSFQHRNWISCPSPPLGQSPPCRGSLGRSHLFWQVCGGMSELGSSGLSTGPAVFPGMAVVWEQWDEVSGLNLSAGSTFLCLCLCLQWTPATFDSPICTAAVKVNLLSWI